MRILRNLHDCDSYLSASRRDSRRVVGLTIGNFDGVHLGHQELFRCLRDGLANRTQPGETPLAGCFTFFPHPKRRLAGNSVNLLTSDRQRLRLLAQQDLQFTYLQRFTPSFYELGADEFIERYLVQGLHVSLVVVGDDWCFGKNRAGNARYLLQAGEALGFSVIIVPPVIKDGGRISSTRIRSILDQGDVDALESLLGRRYAIEGRIAPGDGRGRTLGFPTANLYPQGIFLPPNGVYAAEIKLKGNSFPAVINIGVRPTFGTHSTNVEVHFLGAVPPLGAGQVLAVEPVRFLRPEMHFQSVEALKAQIARDVQYATDLLMQPSERT